MSKFFAYITLSSQSWDILCKYMPFVLWKKKAEPTVDRQRQVDVGYAVRRLEQGDLSLVAGCMIGRSVVFTMHNISLMEPRRSQAVEGWHKVQDSKGPVLSSSAAQSIRAPQKSSQRRIEV